MSKNSKNARLNREAKERSASRKNGNKLGPSEGRATAPKHGKKKAWWQIFHSYSDFIKGGGKKAQRGQLPVEEEAAA